MNAPSILPDGTPHYALWAEDWLIGGVLLAGRPEHVLGLPVECRDFRDQTCGVIWKAVLTASEHGAPTIPAVAAELDRMGWLDRIGAEPRLMELTGDAQAYLMAATDVGMTIHAEVVREWGEKRRAIQSLSLQAKAVYEGRPKSVTPFRRLGGVSTDVNVA